MVDAAGNIGGVLSPVIEVGKWLAAPIWRQFKYLYNYNTNFQNLEQQVGKLKNTRDEVQHKVTAAERNVEEIKQIVKKWQKDVEKAITEAEQLIQVKTNNPRCFKGLCPNSIIHYKQSKKAFKLRQDDIDPLLQQEKELGSVSHPANPPEIWLRSSEDYLAFESRNSTVKNVWDALNDEKVFMIGVYGMGGLGKTTLVQEAGRKAEKDNLFEDIVFVEVTQNLDIEKVQTKIAEKLGIKFSNETERANKLYDKLRSGKKILLILDNIWEDIDLKTIAIPSKTDRGGCKLMFTTRNLDVLQKMGSTNNYMLGILAEKEAWELFAEMAGDVIQTHELNSLPNDVCKECGGLPIVICTIAKALKNKSHPSDWKVALQELRAPSPRKFTGFLEKEYMKMALSYDYLRNEELKKTFLISGLMENNTSISDLFKHVVCLDILEGANLTMEEARDRLDKLVRDLKGANLLLDGLRSEQFAMHDAIRAVALTIAYVDHHVFTSKNDIEREWKDKDKLKKCTKISLHDSSTIMSQLQPKDLDCPVLEYFYMSSSYLKIPKDFFTMMPKLKVLNLVQLHRSSLPSSLHLLKNLQTLCLHNSTINNVAIIGNLKKLKVLSLKQSFIKELPKETGQLTELKLLDLSYCEQLQVIVPNVISKLLQLEEFYIKGCPIQWKVDVLKELKLLSNLSSVELDIRDNKVLPKNLFAKEPKRYKISVGDCSVLHEEYGEPERYEKHELLRMLKISFNSIRSLEELHGFKNIELLQLAQFSEDENYAEDSKFDFQSNEIMPLFNEKVIFTNFRILVLYNISLGKIWDNRISTSSQNLKRLKLERCGKMTYVFTFSIAKSLKQLQSLEIIDCEVLEKIVEEEDGAKVVVHSIFPQVTKLVLKSLPKLATLYPGIHALEFPMLKRLVIENCENLTSTYLGLRDDNKKGALPISKSKFLCLENKINCNLENFRLRDGVISIGWSSQYKVLSIWRDISANIPCGLFQRFQSVKRLNLRWCEYKEINSVSNLPNLEDLYVKKCGKLTSLMPSSASFQNLKFLNVYGVDGLVALTTPSVARSLVQLRELKLSFCEILVEIIENEGDATTSSKIVFDNLKLLYLTQLQCLTCFCSGNYSFNFSSLEELIIEECPNLKTFSQGMLSTPKLRKVNYEGLVIENEGNDLNKIIHGLCKKKGEEISVDVKYKAFRDDNSTKICYDQHPTSFYQNLTCLMIWNFGNIKYAFPPSIAKSFHQLQQLVISDCKALKEIVAKEGENVVVNFVFLNLTLLKLQNLPELTVFYPEIHTSEWPKLEELVVGNCAKYLSFKENNEEIEFNILDPKSIFLEDKVGSDIRTLNLNGRDIMVIWQGEFQENFCIVETLELIMDEYKYIPIQILQKFVSLKKLILKVSSYEELFSFGEGEKDIGVITNLKQLELWGLFNLKCISKQDSRLNSILQNLHSLYVNNCHNLTALLLSSQSFENLRTLRVHHCNGMQNLMISSTAKSLVCLENLSIKECEIMIEVLADERDIENGEIVFKKLKYLTLRGIESLTHFYSGNYTLKFPLLERLYVSRCFKMKTFSRGDLSMPRLVAVNSKNCSSDLNSVTQQLQNDCAKLWERFPW